MLKTLRNGSFDHGSKCTDILLVSKGMLEIVGVIELIEWNKIEDSYHQRCSIDLGLGDFLTSSSTKKMIEKMFLNPNSSFYRKAFVSVG